MVRGVKGIECILAIYVIKEQNLLYPEINGPLLWNLVGDFHFRGFLKARELVEIVAALD
jgi:hypothetical protein